MAYLYACKGFQGKIMDVQGIHAPEHMGIRIQPPPADSTIPSLPSFTHFIEAVVEFADKGLHGRNPGQKPPRSIRKPKHGTILENLKETIISFRK